jgi:hypothetical protein
MIERNYISLIFLFSLIFFVGCEQNKSSNNINNKSENSTHLENQGLKGKVKSYVSKSYEVNGYEFGEPKFELRSTDITNFNIYGYVTESESKYQSEYYNDYFKESYEYSNPKSGIILIRRYENTRDNEQKYFIQNFTYDTISNKVIERKTVNEKENTSTSYIYSYDENQVRISEYNNNTNELVSLTIEKLDNKGGLISSIDYDDEGVEDDEKHIVKLQNGFMKDSSVFRFSDKRIYNISVVTFDNLGREVKYKRYEDDLNENEGYTIEYDNSDMNSSFTKKEFKRNEDLIFKKIRVDKKYDDLGNVIEIQKLNLDSNKLEEKTVVEITYYD